MWPYNDLAECQYVVCSLGIISIIGQRPEMTLGCTTSDVSNQIFRRKAQCPGWVLLGFS